MEEYYTNYSRRRKQLLSDRSIQATYDYRYTVYTTWEVSIEMIQNISNRNAENAIEILHLFAFLHFDDMSEDIFEEAWKNLQQYEILDWILSNQLRILREDISGEWDPYPIREATTLLSSFSLISIDGPANRISMHPLVHAWAKDRLLEVEQERLWRIAASTLAMSIPYEYLTFYYNFEDSSYLMLTLASIPKKVTCSLMILRERNNLKSLKGLPMYIKTVADIKRCCSLTRRFSRRESDCRAISTSIL